MKQYCSPTMPSSADRSRLDVASCDPTKVGHSFLEKLARWAEDSLLAGLALVHVHRTDYSCFALKTENPTKNTPESIPGFRWAW
jgi:hypothetical protein